MVWKNVRMWNYVKWTYASRPELVCPGDKFSSCDERITIVRKGMRTI